MIDASHANSGYDPENQPVVVDAVARQVENGNRCIIGVMIESHLVGGRQDLVRGKPLTLRPEHHRRLHRLGHVGRGDAAAGAGGQGAACAGNRRRVAAAPRKLRFDAEVR